MQIMKAEEQSTKTKNTKGLSQLDLRSLFFRGSAFMQIKNIISSPL